MPSLGLPRIASHVHDGRCHYAHRIPRHRARFLYDGRFKLSISTRRGYLGWCRHRMAYGNDNNTGLVNEDASIGIIFPLLFSIAIILVSLYSGNAYLDVDTALLGEIAFAL